MGSQQGACPFPSRAGSRMAFGVEMGQTSTYLPTARANAGPCAPSLYWGGSQTDSSEDSKPD